MSAPFTNFIPLAVLSASLLGSGHCVAMCGGLIVAVAPTRQSVIRYHLGRLIGYCTLGGIAGYIGEVGLGSEHFSSLSWLFSAMIALSFIFLGYRVWNQRPLHLFKIPNVLWKKFASFGAGMTGLMSAFLPCGWLHVFILGAVATQDMALGALSLLLFWAGTLPALTLTPWLTQKIFKPLSIRSPRLAALILIFLGVASLSLKLWPHSMHDHSHMHHAISQ